jgi:N-acyl homoserine lactone hydrolase
MITIDTVFGGFPGRTSRGFLGWGAVYLVTNERGERILFDTGGSNERATIIPELAKLSVSPDAVRTLVLSHLHYDHAANWDLFPNAEIVVHEREMEHAKTAQGPKSELAYRVRALYDGAKLRVVSEDCELAPGFRLLHAPGHTAGCMALQFGRTIICGDAVKNRWDLRGEVPKRGSMWDANAFLESINKLSGMADKLYPGHDVPFERRADGWRPIGYSSVTLHFPNGQSQEIEFREQAERGTSGR